MLSPVSLLGMPVTLSLALPVAAVLAALSGLPGFFLPRGSRLAQLSSLVFMLLAAVIGLAGAVSVLLGAPGFALELPWPQAPGAFLGLDALSAFFLVPIFLMAALGSIYGLGYWPQTKKPRSARKLQLFWGLLVAGMCLLVTARQGLAFILGWEVMALSAFFLITSEDNREECRAAGWIYFIATHVGTLLLFAFFALWRWSTGSFALLPLAAGSLSTASLNLLFFLALIAFGLKAGVMPLHFWLPGAHAAAPSHVSAILSGVVLKMGIYGLMRFLLLIPDPPAIWGGIILVLGGVSGLLGVVFALGQHDLKRLLAYHSVENIGIILMGFGLAMIGRAQGQPVWVVLGLAGSLLHVWNHGLFKSLLFFGAGSVVHRSGTRQLDRLGALAAKMPWTAALFLAGAVAICGLPPLNGFVSEFLVYFGSLKTLNLAAPGASALALIVPVLAMIGALAVACFVKVYGAVFLGLPRAEGEGAAPGLGPASAGRRWPGESPATMIAPMLVLALLCAAIGLAPALLAPLLDGILSQAQHPAAVTYPELLSLVPLREIGLAAALLLGLGALALILARRTRRGAAAAGTWDCGYARPTARMQYTASSFAQPIVSMFSWILRPRQSRPRVQGPFPAPAALESHVVDATLDRFIVPASRELVRRFGWFRRFQQGLTQQYVLYLLVAVLVLLCTLIPFGEIFASVFGR